MKIIWHLRFNESHFATVSQLSLAEKIGTSLNWYAGVGAGVTMCRAEWVPFDLWLINSITGSGHMGIPP